MKITYDLLEDLHHALDGVAKRHSLHVLAYPLASEQWLGNEIEFSFTLCEMSDKELEDSKCG